MDDTETAGATVVHVLWFPMRRSSVHRKLVAAPGKRLDRFGRGSGRDLNGERQKGSGCGDMRRRSVEDRRMMSGQHRVGGVCRRRRVKKARRESGSGTGTRALGQGTLARTRRLTLEMSPRVTVRPSRLATLLSILTALGGLGDPLRSRWVELRAQESAGTFAGWRRTRE